jgi:hypothetical protein
VRALLDPLGALLAAPPRSRRNRVPAAHRRRALGLRGVDSYRGPILVLPTLYVAYFFPPRLAWPLAVIEITTYSTPVLYSDASHQHLLYGRTVMYAAAYAGLVATIQYLKSHLVAAEQRQRQMAHTDPLTGLPNRRAFDDALDSAVAGAARSRCCSSTSTGSSRSTTRSDTRSAMRCCARSPRLYVAGLHCARHEPSMHMEAHHHCRQVNRT